MLLETGRNSLRNQGHEFPLFRNPHLLLGRMDIDIGQIGVNLNIDDREWKTSYHQLAAVAIQNSTIEQEILNIAAVDENRNIIPIGAS